MLEFENIYLLLLLLLLPVFVGLYILAKKQNAATRQRFGNWEVLQKLIPNYAQKRSPLKFALLLGAYSLLIVALANPRVGSRTQKIKREGIDLYIALDISRSMWAKDVTPKGFDRLEKARLFALKLVEELSNDRVGLIFFAGEAFLQMPLTLDYSAVKLFLNDGLGDAEIMQGTALDEVIELAVKTGANDEKKHQRALLIISDGEDHDKKGVDAAKEGKANGVTTYTIAVGSTEGVPIPLDRQKEAGFHTNRTGSVVQSKVDKDWLKKIANAGGGEFFDMDQSNVIGKLRNSFSRIEKEAFDEQRFDEYESYFQWPLLLALILLVIEYLITFRKNKLEAVATVFNADAKAAKEELAELTKS